LLSYGVGGDHRVVREGASVRTLIDQDELEAEPLIHSLQDERRSSIAAVHHHLQRLQRREVKNSGQSIQVRIDGVFAHSHPAHRLPFFEPKLA
jgi:hypothetical protein